MKSFTFIFLYLQDKLENIEKQKVCNNNFIQFYKIVFLRFINTNKKNLQNLRKLNLLEEEKHIKECEESKIRQHQNKSNNDKVIEKYYIIYIYDECMVVLIKAF